MEAVERARLRRNQEKAKELRRSLDQHVGLPFPLSADGRCCGVCLARSTTM